MLKMVIAVSFLALILGCGESAAPPDVADTGADSVVSFENPGGTPVKANLPSETPPSAQPEGLITWTRLPTISDWTLVAAGVLQEHSTLVMWQEEQAPAFAVYYKGHSDPMVILLPDLPLGQMWETDETIAPTNFEMEGPTFSFEAHSPLFGDTSGNLELHAFGYDSAGNKVTLSVVTIR